MEPGNLVKISCTCGDNHDEDPLIAVVVKEDSQTKMIEVLIKGYRTWIPKDGFEVVKQ